MAKSYTTLRDMIHVAQAMEMAKQAHPDPHICSPGQQNHVDNEPAFYPH